MEDYQEFTYKLTITSLEKPSLDQLLDFANELGDLVESHAIEIEEVKND